MVPRGEAARNQLFLSLWPGENILLVWGADALDAIRAQSRGTSALPPKPQCGHKYGIVLVSKTASTNNLYQLYGGEPVLVVNAEAYTYGQMCALSQGTFTRRTVYATPDVPYWHHTFMVQERPFNFSPALTGGGEIKTFCSSCLTRTPIPCTHYIHDTHPICAKCATFDIIECYHVSHKREYIEQEDACIYFGTDSAPSYHPCSADQCSWPVDDCVRCEQCNEKGYCSAECLLKHHACFFTTALQ